MPIAKKVTKPVDEALLQYLPATRKVEVPIGNNIYELYSLPKESFMGLSSAVKSIAESVRLRIEDKQAEGIDAAKDLSKSIGQLADPDVQRSAIQVVEMLSQKKIVDPLEFLFSDELQEHIDHILEVCLEGVDKEDIKDVTADQLSRISEAIFVLNFLGFIRTIQNASYFFQK